VIDVLDAAGYDVVIVETVGAGQSDVEIGLLADTRVVVCPAGLGDDVQAIKSGLLEIADIYAVNKADSSFAERTERDLAGMISLRNYNGWVPQIVRTVATSGSGVTALVEAIEAHEASGGARVGPRERVHRLIAAGTADWFKQCVDSHSSPEFDAPCDAYARGDITPRGRGDRRCRSCWRERGIEPGMSSHARWLHMQTPGEQAKALSQTWPVWGRARLS